MIPPVGVLAGVIGGLGLDVDTARACAELEALLGRPWADHVRGARVSGSSLTESGAPFELSVKIADDEVSVRYVVDVADPAAALQANRGRYLAAAEKTLGQPAGVVSRLLSTHLDDAPDGTLANVMIGVGWASGDRRRSTLYVPAGWVAADVLEHRLPGPTGLSEPAQVVGYDVEEGSLSRWKTYHWFTVDPDVRLASQPGHDGMSPLAVDVCDHFAKGVPAPLRERAAFRQRRFGAGATADRLFLFTRPWGLAEGPALSTLLSHLAGAGLDLAPLRVVARAGRDHDLPLHLGLVSAGGGESDPSATFYFWPRPLDPSPGQALL